MLYEIRNYHFDPELFEEYKKWSRELALPYVKTVMDVVGFWVKNDISVEYGGALPKNDDYVPSNVTWVIRWKDKEHREKVFNEFRDLEEWNRIRAKVPGGQKSYFREEAKFAEAI